MDDPRHRVYLDWNATTPLHPKAREAMIPFLADPTLFGNPSSVHWYGRRVRKAVEEARAAVARLVGARDPWEIVFTSGATESANQVIHGVARAYRDKGDHLVASAAEHAAVKAPCAALAAEGVRTTYVPVDAAGLVDPAVMEAACEDRTILVNLMHANNETGTVQPIAEVARRVRSLGIMVHSDAAQTAGKVPINAPALDVDFISGSAHKFGGPKGTGFLYVREGRRLAPLIEGGSHERGRRAGTENVPGIIGMGAAALAAMEEMEAVSKQETGLRDRLWGGIRQHVPGARLNGSLEHRLPNTLSISFDGVDWEGLIIALDLEGVAVSTGSACKAGAVEPSDVLKAMGIPPALARGTARFSLGRSTNEADIDYVLSVLPGVIARLRRAPKRAARATV